MTPRLNSTHLQVLKDQGYCHIPRFLDPAQCHSMKSECDIMAERFYSQANIEKGFVYPSDRSEGRVSHAMLVSQGMSFLPAINSL